MYTPTEDCVDYMGSHVSDVMDLGYSLDGIVYDYMLEPITRAYETWDDVKRYIQHLEEEISDLKNEIEDLRDSHLRDSLYIGT